MGEDEDEMLYELSDDAKRKEWLDDWLSFMHRIGSSFVLAFSHLKLNLSPIRKTAADSFY
ncbi:hypothetical protein ANCDUO_00951 [Ancylostoma duodenale]|uniref:Uncharacterized protein n=1 Tax=Ancylostoma duodenale TaxID=51022 RepID=A0A0C2H4G6_9BILA|nr:hypothetical protein ANCDUO_00951 [Ancylostoma duodenale]